MQPNQADNLQSSCVHSVVYGLWGLIFSHRCDIFSTLIENPFKDTAHLSTFKIFIFEKLSCLIVLVVFLVIVQSSELIFCVIL